MAAMASRLSSSTAQSISVNGTCFAFNKFWIEVMYFLVVNMPVAEDEYKITSRGMAIDLRFSLD